jgi:hypothetical protein
MGYVEEMVTSLQTVNDVVVVLNDVFTREAPHRRLRLSWRTPGLCAVSKLTQAATHVAGEVAHHEPPVS